MKMSDHYEDIEYESGQMHEQEFLEEHQIVEVLEEQMEFAGKIDVEHLEDDPYNIVTNILRIFTNAHGLIYELNSSEFPVGSPAYIENVLRCGNVCLSCIPLSTFLIDPFKVSCRFFRKYER